MQSTLLSAFVFHLAMFQQLCSGLPLQKQAQTSQQKTQTFPRFMQDMYYHFLSGKHPSNIIHSNTAQGIKRSNSSFEAIFDDLSFTQNETLKFSQLRLTILKQNQCTLNFTLRLMDDESLQVLDEYNEIAQNNGVKLIPLTSSLQKLVLAPSHNKRLRVKITFHKSTAAQCDHSVNRLSNEAYLVTSTDDNHPTRYGRDTELHPRYTKRNTKKSILRKRSASSSSNKTCTMSSRNVALAGRIVLPHSFSTGVCGKWHPIPLSSDPVVVEVARAIYKASKKWKHVKNPSCCIASSFGKLAVLYFNSNTRHSVLRYLDNIIVTQCACMNDT